MPGQAAYDQPNPWVWTVKTPGDYLVRNSLEQLSFDTINDETGCGVYGIPCPDRTIDVAVIAPNCDVLRVYRLFGVYVESLSPIEYDQTDNNFTTFTVNWRYQYWRLVNPYDTGAIDNATTTNTIDDVYNSYESKILNAKAGCAVGFVTPR